MELSPEILKATTSAIKEVERGLTTAAKEAGHTVPKAADVVEYAKVSAETLRAYALSTLKKGTETSPIHSSATVESVTKALKPEMKAGLEGLSESKKLITEKLKDFRAQIENGTLKFRDNDAAIKAYEKLLNEGTNMESFFSKESIPPQKFQDLMEHGLTITTINEFGITGFHAEEGYQKFLELAKQQNGVTDITEEFKKFVTTNKSIAGNYKNATITAEYLGKDPDGKDVINLIKSKPGDTPVHIKITYNGDSTINYHLTKGNASKESPKTLAPQEDLRHVINEFENPTVVASATCNDVKKGFAVEYNGKYYLVNMSKNDCISSIHPIKEEDLIKRQFIIPLIPKLK